jgi:hypothetical protein
MAYEVTSDAYYLMFSSKSHMHSILSPVGIGVSSVITSRRAPGVVASSPPDAGATVG